MSTIFATRGTATLDSASIAPRAAKQKQTKAYGTAQANFIKETRAAIDADGKGFFLKNHWLRVSAGGGRSSNLKCASESSLLRPYPSPYRIDLPHSMYLYDILLHVQSSSLL